MVFALKQESLLTFDSLALGQKWAVELSLRPLKNMLQRSMVEAFHTKQRLRNQILGCLRPFAVRDCLFSFLICPGLFLQSAFDKASDLLKASMDSLNIRDWRDKIPSFLQAPSQPSQSFRALPARSHNHKQSTDPGVLPRPRHTPDSPMVLLLLREATREARTDFAPAWVGAPQQVLTSISRGFHRMWLDTPPCHVPPRFTQTRPDLLIPVQD